MSQYATIADLALYGLPAAGLPATVSPDTKTAWLVSASALADSYLGSRFRLPLLVWGTDLTAAVAAIAICDLVSSQVGFNPDQEQGLQLNQRRKDAVRWFEQIAAGHATPTGVTDTVPAASSIPRVFSKPMRGW